MMIQSPINGLTSDRPLSVPYRKRLPTDGDRLWITPGRERLPSNHWIDRKDRLNKPINGYSDV